MRKLKHLLDASMQGVTMYKGILWGLLSVIAVGEILALLGVIGISAGGLALMTLVIAVACFLSNWLFAALLKAPSNSESWLISALIITCIVAPSTSPERLAFAALAGVIAMASKYFIAWRGAMFLNPAATGAFVLSVTNQLPAIWWIATPWMLLITVPLALATLYNHRKFTMFGVFFAAAFAVLLIINANTQQDSWLTVLNFAITSWPLIFLGSIMLTEPNTLPAQRYLQLVYALIVGALTTAQLSYGPVDTSPLLALLVGNIFMAFVMPPWAARLRLVDHQILAGDTHEFTFAKPKRMEYQAGQYMDWTLAHKKADIRGNRRRFSIASAPAEKELRLVTRIGDKPSSFKYALLNMDIDEHLRAATIRGEFVLPSKPKKLLWIAGGIGISPFRSMAAQLVVQGKECDIVLVYASSTKDFVYADVLKKAKKIGITTHLTDSRLDADALRAIVPDISEREAYVAGPPAMVTAYSEQLRDMGLRGRAIHTDNFKGY